MGIDTINKAIGDQNNKIGKNSQDISANAKAITTLNAMDTNINSKIADLTKELDDLKGKFGQFAVCPQSAEHSLGSATYGQYTGNCASGSVFQSSDCRFECKRGTWAAN